MNHDQTLDEVFEHDVFVRQFFDSLNDIGFRESGGHVVAETVKEIFDRVGTSAGYLSFVSA